MEQPSAPPVSNFLPASLTLAALGGAGLYVVARWIPPNGGSRWLLFFLGVLAATGVVLPVMALLNRRFPSSPPVLPLVVVRQALWVSIYLATLVWLQLGRVLSPSLALLLAIGLILIEWLLRLRERAQWKP